MAFPLSIQQIGGPARGIILQGRSLPYQEAEFGGMEQRLEKNHPSGSPVASTQVIGHTHIPTQFEGEWKDIFLFDDANAPRLIAFPTLTTQALPGATSRGGKTFQSAGSIPSQRAQTARAIVDAFLLLLKEGVMVRVEWGHVVRFGFVKRFLPKWRRVEDCPFELNFEWVGETNNLPIRLLPKLELISLLKALLALLDKIINALLTVIFKAEAFLRKVTQFITKIGAFVTALLDALKRITDFVFAPQNILQIIKANLTAIKLAARDFAASLAIAPSAAYETAVSGSPGELIMANLFQADFRRDMINAAADAAEKIAKINEFAAPRLLGVVEMVSGKTLREVAAEFYDSPDNWRALAEFNGFETSIVPSGTLVRVPDLSGGA